MFLAIFRQKYKTLSRDPVDLGVTRWGNLGKHDAFRISPGRYCKMYRVYIDFAKNRFSQCCKNAYFLADCANIYLKSDVFLTPSKTHVCSDIQKTRSFLQVVPRILTTSSCFQRFRKHVYFETVEKHVLFNRLRQHIFKKWRVFLILTCTMEQQRKEYVDVSRCFQRNRLHLVVTAIHGLMLRAHAFFNIRGNIKI